MKYWCIIAIHFSKTNTQTDTNINVLLAMEASILLALKQG